MYSICSVQDGNSRLVILFLIPKVSITLNIQNLSRRTELDTYVGDSKYGSARFW